MRISSVLLALALTAVAAQAAPERLLAGYTIQNTCYVTLHDPRARAYFIRTGECDGTFRYLVLARSLEGVPREILEESRSTPLAEGRLRTLATGSGVALDDRPADVRRKLGAPTWQGGSRVSKAERVWSYHWRTGQEEKARDVTLLLRFREGRIACIELHSIALDN